MSKETRKKAAGKAARKPAAGAVRTYPIEEVAIGELRPHPENYKAHPEDQLAHIVSSLEQHGIYRNVVIAREGTILAGHGVVLAAKKKGLTSLPVIRLPIAPDSPEARKVLAGDNEIGHLAEVNDRALTELLKTIQQADPAGLLGTGYDEKMLANLLFVTRPEGEIATKQEAAQWVGMPSYDEGQGKTPQIVVSFDTVELRDEFVKASGIGLQRAEPGRMVWSAWWPPREKKDNASVRFEAPKPEGGSQK
jgi:hypothetical protein